MKQQQLVAKIVLIAFFGYVFASILFTIATTLGFWSFISSASAIIAVAWALEVVLRGKK